MHRTDPKRQTDMTRSSSETTAGVSSQAVVKIRKTASSAETSSFLKQLHDRQYQPLSAASACPVGILDRGGETVEVVYLWVERVLAISIRT